MVALSAPSAESIAERTFSCGKQHKSDMRTRLGPKRFEAAVIVDMDSDPELNDECVECGFFAGNFWRDEV